VKDLVLSGHGRGCAIVCADSPPAETLSAQPDVA